MMQQSFPKKFEKDLEYCLNQIVDLNYIDNIEISNNKDYIVHEVKTKSPINTLIRILGIKTKNVLVDISEFNILIYDDILKDDNVIVKKVKIAEIPTLAQFKDWINLINRRIKKLKQLEKDEKTHSPVNQFINEFKKFKNNNVENEDENYPIEEQRQLEKKLDDFEKFLIKDFNPNEYQKNEIREKKLRLKKLLPILTKKEWWLLLLSNLQSIYNLLNFTIEKGKEFMLLFENVISPSGTPPIPLDIFIA